MHFFIEPEKLNPQMQDSYGPVMNDIANKYHTGSLFTCNQDAKLFACQSGMMIVQPHIGQDGNVDPTLVNIILKPNSGLEIPFSSVKYYIYRGVDINSFLSGTNVVPASTLSTEFINKFWDNWDNLINNLNEQDANSQSTTTTQLPSPNTFGYEDISLPEALASTTLVEEIYNSEESDNPLVRKFQAIKVEEGEWIGNICAGVNFIFEVIIDTDHLVIDLAYVRKFQNVIDVSLLGNITAEEKFIIKAEREKILNYIDPAALFGMFYESGINVSDYQNSNRSSILKKGAELYTEILEKFYTKNRVYLDIRSERGYSYNYYNNYGDEDGNIIRALRKDDNLMREAALTPNYNFVYNYHNYNNWPIFCIDTITGSNSGIEILPYNHIEIALRVDDNLKPVLFAENPNVLLQNTNSYFIDEKELVEENNTNWTKKITIQYPNFPNSSTKLDIANYVKLQYFRKADNILSPNTVLKSGNYLDAVFSGISSSIVTIPSVFKNDKKVKKHFINAGDDDFQYVSENNLTANESEVLFLTYNDFSLKKSTNTYPVINLSHFESQSISENYILPKNIIYNKWQANDGSNNIAILEIVGYNKQDSIATPMEDIFMLGLTKEEWEALNAIPNVSNLHQKYLYFEDASNTTDTITGLAYTKYRLKVQGLDNKGEVIIAAPSSDISVYCSSPNLLASHEFAYNTIIPNNGISDPSIKGPYNTKKISYDGSDVDVQAVAGNGIVSIYDDKYNQEKISDKIDVELIGNIYFPVKNTTDNVPISSALPCPLIVIIHGNGQDYNDYDELSEHLASNGFVVNVISCKFKKNIFFLKPNSIIDSSIPEPYTHSFLMDEVYLYNSIETNEDKKFAKLEFHSSGFNINPIRLQNYSISGPFIIMEFDQNTQGMGVLARSILLNYHLKVIRQKFSVDYIKNNIGLLGHSRGGEAILIAARNNYESYLETIPAPDTLNNIVSLASLAPTNFSIQTLDINIPYYVLYGSRDGDVHGGPYVNTGFDIWDKHDKALYKNEKMMSFVYKASHNGFITNNSDYPEKDSQYIILSPSIQKSISKAYFNAFFLKTLKGQYVWNRIFQGLEIPKSIQTKEIYPQYRNLKDTQRWILDNFEHENYALGNTDNNRGVASFEGLNKRNHIVLTNSIPNSAHKIEKLNCVKIEGQDNNEKYLKITIGTTINIDSYKFISFRIAHVFQDDEKYCDLSELKIKLLDSNNNSSISGITQKIPIPDRRIDMMEDGSTTVMLSKTAFTSIITPLGDNFVGGANKGNIKEIQIIFPSSKIENIIFKDFELIK